MRARLRMTFLHAPGELSIDREYPWPSAPRAGDGIEWRDGWAVQTVNAVWFLSDGRVLFDLGRIPRDSPDVPELVAAGWKLYDPNMPR